MVEDSDDLAPLFSARPAPSAPFLAERIIARARSMPRRTGLVALLLSVLPFDVRRPVPASALAGLVLFGFWAAQPFSREIEARIMPEPVAVSDVPVAFYDEAAL